MKRTKSLTLLAQVATAAGPVNAKPGKAQTHGVQWNESVCRFISLYITLNWWKHPLGNFIYFPLAMFPWQWQLVVLQLTCQPLLLPVHRGLSLDVYEEGGEQNTAVIHTSLPTSLLKNWQSWHWTGYCWTFTQIHPICKSVLTMNGVAANIFT